MKIFKKFQIFVSNCFASLHSIWPLCVPASPRNLKFLVNIKVIINRWFLYFRNTFPSPMAYHFLAITYSICHFEELQSKPNICGCITIVEQERCYTHLGSGVACTYKPSIENAWKWQTPIAYLHKSFIY
jgi:hypothetical protein